MNNCEQRSYYSWIVGKFVVVVVGESLVLVFAVGWKEGVPVARLMGE